MVMNGLGQDINNYALCLQLQPVNGKPVFEKYPQIPVLQTRTCGIFLWRDCILYDELTINEQQELHYTVVVGLCVHLPQLQLSTQGDQST